MGSNGPPPDLDPNETRVPTILAVTTAVLTVAFVAVSLRTYTRAVMLRQFGVDDWSAIFAFLLVLACGFCVAWNTRYGFGRHVYLMTPDMIKKYMRTFYMSIVFYNAALTGIKMTFLLQYYRVFAVRGVQKRYIIAMVIVGSWSLSQVLVEIFICTPIEAFWDADVKGRCIPNYPQWYINAAGNIVTDLIVFCLPLPAIRKLTLHHHQKVILFFIFSLGFFTCAISFVRIRFLKLTEDFTWANIESAGWSIGELCSGITCSCLPTFRPLFSKYWPALASRVYRSTKQCPTGSSNTTRSHIADRSHKSSHRGTVFSTERDSEPLGAPQLPPIALSFEANSAMEQAKTGGNGDWASMSDSSIGIPIMRPDVGMAKVETRIAASREGSVRSIGRRASYNTPIRVSFDIVQTSSPQTPPA